MEAAWFCGLAAGGCTLDPSCPRAPAAMHNMVTAITARAAMPRDGMRAGRIPLTARSPIYLCDYAAAKCTPGPHPAS